MACGDRVVWRWGMGLNRRKGSEIGCGAEQAQGHAVLRYGEEEEEEGGGGGEWGKENWRR
eukprot:2002860-Rhodomonas_salina.1